MKYSLLQSFVNKKNIQYFSIFVVLYLFFLIINLPAAMILSSVKLPNNIKLYRVSGTVWSGRAEQLKIVGIDLGAVKWDLHPLYFIMGELAADISISNNKQYINSEISLSYSGKVEFEETRFSIDLSSLAPLTYGMPFAYSGKASGYFPISSFHKNNFIALNGKLSLMNIELISPQRQSFGDFSVDFRAEKAGETLGKIKDLGGVLSLSGQLKFKKNGLVNLSAKLASRESGNSVDRIISFLGKKDADGRVQLNNSFKLWH